MRKQRRAFTLLEMMAAVVILALIATFILPRSTHSIDKAKECTCFHHRTNVNRAVERYHIETGSWPADDLSTFAGSHDFFPFGVPDCPVSGDSYRLDPTTHRVVGHDGAGNHSP